MQLHHTIPTALENWLKRDAEKRGYRLALFGMAFKIRIRTKAAIDKDHREYLEQQQARERYRDEYY